MIPALPELRRPHPGKIGLRKSDFRGVVTRSHAPVVPISSSLRRRAPALPGAKTRAEVQLSWAMLFALKIFRSPNGLCIGL
jgi:hypothetical protein